MKKLLLAMLLVSAITAVAQTASAPAPSPAAPQKKEIKDPAEYNAYVGAVQQQDAAAKVSGLEAFLAQYPNSVMKEDALVSLMGRSWMSFRPASLKRGWITMVQFVSTSGGRMSKSGRYMQPRGSSPPWPHTITPWLFESFIGAVAVSQNAFTPSAVSMRRAPPWKPYGFCGPIACGLWLR